MPLYGDGNCIKWFEVEPWCVFHILNCLEVGNEEVVIWACKARRSIIPSPNIISSKISDSSSNSVEENDVNNVKDDLCFTRAHEWRLNMQSGKVKERYLTGTGYCMEFPVTNEKFVGIKNKYGYIGVVDAAAPRTPGDMGKFGGVAKLYFLEKGIGDCPGDKQPEDLIKIECHMLAKNICTGAAFVPRVGGLDEDEGWIIAFVVDENTNISQVYMIDAKKFSRKLIAKISLPKRVPYGFHGAFVPISAGFIKQD